MMNPLQPRYSVFVNKLDIYNSRFLKHGIIMCDGPDIFMMKQRCAGVLWDYHLNMVGRNESENTIWGVVRSTGL